MLTGTQLLSKVDEMQAQNPPAPMSEIVRECGYVVDGKLKYTAFYTELLEVKGLLDKKEPTEISDEYQELYDELTEKYSEEAVDAFLELYDESDLEYFEEAYYGEYKSEADFAEDFTNDSFGYEAPSFVVIDWQSTWDQGLSYDFDYEDGFVFNKNW
jgi:hypothetical protein